MTLLIGACVFGVGAVAVSFAWRWQRRYSRVHPRRRDPRAVVAGRALPALAALSLCGVGIRVALTDLHLYFWVHVAIGVGFFLLAIAVAVLFLRWIRGREKTEATRRIASQVLVTVVVLFVLAWGFVGAYG